ncbi:MAG: hypothetical protein IIW60_08610, partial [Alistipes sp.]|nr:hypothetical protein [Alistipes sp.]
ARQEAGRIGGIGACGRELCCASWISSFSSVTTNAARVQDISLNPLKLAGQCSKLKCCLMYEYDVYADARQTLPRVREPLQAIDGEYYLVKTDILGHTMSFSSSKDAMVNVVTIPTKRVREILAMNRAGKKVESLIDKDSIVEVEEPTFRTKEDSITRFDNQNKRRRNNNRKGKEQRQQKANNNSSDNNASAEGGQNEGKEQRDNHEHRQRRDNRHRRDNRNDNRAENHDNRTEKSNATPQGADNNTPKEQHEGQRHNRRNFRDRHNNRHNRRNHDGGNNGGNGGAQE